MNDLIYGIICISIGFAIGFVLNNMQQKEFKQPLQPTVKIECNNTVCDTTYIYNFNLD